jgi:hypothetical protein
MEILDVDEPFPDTFALSAKTLPTVVKSRSKDPHGLEVFAVQQRNRGNAQR